MVSSRLPQRQTLQAETLASEIARTVSCVVRVVRNANAPVSKPSCCAVGPCQRSRVRVLHVIAGKMYIPISAKAALLQALLDGPGYGHDLVERIHTRSLGKIHLLQGSVYPALKTLEEDGLISSSEGKQHGGVNRMRTHYKLTAKGRALAKQHREALIGIVQPKVPTDKAKDAEPEAEGSQE